MKPVAETPKTSPEDPMSGGTWVQITFTLDPEHYQILWERAEDERRTLSCLVHEAVINFLKRAKINPARKIASIQDVEGQL
jgi:hypothetical protein